MIRLLISDVRMMEFSPDGRYFTFAELNDSLVERFSYMWYGEGQYPDVITIPYAKVSPEI